MSIVGVDIVSESRLIYGDLKSEFHTYWFAFKSSQDRFYIGCRIRCLSYRGYQSILSLTIRLSMPIFFIYYF